LCGAPRPPTSAKTEHRHLALREINDIRRLVDQDDPERGQSVEAAQRETIHDQLT
jgi:hypothetical protein